MYAVYDHLFLDEEGAAEYMLETGEVCLRRASLRNGQVTFSIDLAGYDWSATLYWRMERGEGTGYLDSIGVRFPFGDGVSSVPVSVLLPKGAPRIRLDGAHNVIRADVVYYLWTSCNGLDRLYLFGDAQSACDVSVRMWLALDDDTKTVYTREGRFVLTYADGLLPRGDIGTKIFDFTEANEDDWDLEQDILYGEGGGIVRALRRLAHDHEVRGERQEDGGCDVLRDGAPPGGPRRGGVQAAERLRDPHPQDQAELEGHARPRGSPPGRVRTRRVQRPVRYDCHGDEDMDGLGDLPPLRGVLRQAVRHEGQGGGVPPQLPDLHRGVPGSRGRAVDVRPHQVGRLSPGLGGGWCGRVDEGHGARVQGGGR